jgi:hypothetical protein
MVFIFDKGKEIKIGKLIFLKLFAKILFRIIQNNTVYQSVTAICF